MPFSSATPGEETIVEFAASGVAQSKLRETSAVLKFVVSWFCCQSFRRACTALVQGKTVFDGRSGSDMIAHLVGLLALFCVIQGGRLAQRSRAFLFVPLALRCKLSADSLGMEGFKVTESCFLGRICADTRSCSRHGAFLLLTLGLSA